jgi:1-acyl-sn-glycerol-3-phosphate acyltransferase
MLTILRGARSLVSVLLVGAFFILGSIFLRLLVLPGTWLFPSQRFLLVSVYTIPTASPVLIVANHQSLVDILQITLLAKPRVPAYVTRQRYARFVPLVSACIRGLGSPIVDPKRDPVGSVEAIRRGARELPHGLILFPEGHRSRDGEILPFRSSGFATILRERPQPVYLVLNDGAFRVRRFVDLLFRVHLIDAVSEVMGPFAPPDPDALQPFLMDLRKRLSDRLAERRRAARETSPSA